MKKITNILGWSWIVLCCLAWGMGIALFGCSKESQSPRQAPINQPVNSCAVNIGLFKNVVWHNVIDSLPTLYFSNDSCLADTVHAGKWSLIDGCKLVAVQSSSYAFEFYINSVTSDTLKIQALSGNVYTNNAVYSTYHR